MKYRIEAEGNAKYRVVDSDTDEIATWKSHLQTGLSRPLAEALSGYLNALHRYDEAHGGHFGGSED
ncbi:hypothetical protein SAMN02927900_04220 [Rhizobium mongolense subsp. loessense]|jgi:hypothetical protein|uniref:PH domain-containing protein n=1 Tax=Rhizobium mongolense subsp. loessense TaxID=158890 RepID=A0A1G4SVE6_9HYPH|nr:hypothetical protein [Rhizobium mongolense]SCW72917.1 hypothetical protein SAMN02927900_04220 [Rhizobium mongolense subsp. loessense]